MIERAVQTAAMSNPIKLSENPELDFPFFKKLARNDTGEAPGHIIPKRSQDTDDQRNGISLCRTHHWAFDRGLFGITDERKVYVPLKELSGNEILEANDSDLIAVPEAFKWHRKNVVV